MSIKVILELNLKPEVADAVANGMGQTLVDTRAFEGCEEITVVRDQDDPGRVLVLEQWATRENYEAYLAWRTERGDMDGLADISTQPYRVSYLDYVRA